jgi:hypothetical protein
LGACHPFLLIIFQALTSFCHACTHEECLIKLLMSGITWYLYFGGPRKKEEEG